MRIAFLLMLLLVGAGVFLALVWWFQRSMIYFPLEQRVAPATSVIPGARDVAFETEDGLRLAGWLVPAEGRDPAPAVLVFNGNAGNRADRAPLGRALSDVGLTVLLFDYRGYGGNPGRPDETGLLRDGRAARAFLAAQPGVDPGRIVYLGESLGAAVAVALAAEHPPAALVLRSPFSSLVAVGRLHYPFLPVGLLLQDRYPSIERIAQVRCPLLVIVGEGDGVVPDEDSRRLFEASPAADKRLVAIPGADHNDERLVAGPEWIRQIVELLEPIEEDR